MFIETEPTPNPNTMKFLPGREVMPRGTAEFRDPAATATSPLAARLFEIGGVTGVFLGADFITVTRSETADWSMLKTQVLGAIMDHYTSGLPIFEGALDEASGDDSEVVQRIKELLETRVRPAVAQDGGDIVFNDFQDGTVFLTLLGSCSGCPSSTATLKHGVENMLRHYVPEVRAVEAVM